MRYGVYPDQSFEESIYDDEGNLIVKRDRLGRETKMVYDAANRLTETILPDATPGIDTDNPRQITKYDAAGQVEWQQDERGNRSCMKYDLAGRNIESTDADNPRSQTGYDAGGRKIAMTDEMGRITRYSYDKLGRLVSVVLPNPSTGANPALINGESPANSGALVTRYEYDEQGNKTAQIYAEGRRTSWTFDTTGRNLTRKLPLGQVESSIYNIAGEQKNQGMQWWRMDWHPAHGAGSNDQIDGNYHFHTQTAP